jgi:hypothetical protein
VRVRGRRVAGLRGLHGEQGMGDWIDPHGSIVRHTADWRLTGR